MKEPITTLKRPYGNLTPWQPDYIEWLTRNLETKQAFENKTDDQCHSQCLQLHELSIHKVIMTE